VQIRIVGVSKHIFCRRQVDIEVRAKVSEDNWVLAMGMLISTNSFKKSTAKIPIEVKGLTAKSFLTAKIPTSTWMLSSLVLREQEETKARYFAPITVVFQPTLIQKKIDFDGLLQFLIYLM
jgi:hypothetical protein